MMDLQQDYINPETKNPKGGSQMVGKRISRYWVVLAVAVCVIAAGSIAMVAAESKTDNDKILNKISNEAAVAMRDVRFARVAIFDGQPEKRLKLLDSAKNNLNTAEKNAPELTVTVKSIQKAGDKAAATRKVTETTSFRLTHIWNSLRTSFRPRRNKRR
jgi:hypothetical protein